MPLLRENNHEAMLSLLARQVLKIKLPKDEEAKAECQNASQAQREERRSWRKSKIPKIQRQRSQKR